MTYSPILTLGACNRNLLTSILKNQYIQIYQFGFRYFSVLVSLSAPVLFFLAHVQKKEKIISRWNRKHRAIIKTFTLHLSFTQYLSLVNLSFNIHQQKNMKVADLGQWKYRSVVIQQAFLGSSTGVECFLLPRSSSSCHL